MTVSIEVGVVVGLNRKKLGSVPDQMVTVHVKKEGQIRISNLLVIGDWIQKKKKGHSESLKRRDYWMVRSAPGSQTSCAVHRDAYQ